MPELQVECPASDLIHESAGGPASYCRIERNLLSEQSDPASLQRFCAGCYTACPTWRADKEAHWEDRSEEFNASIEEDV